MKFFLRLCSFCAVSTVPLVAWGSAQPSGRAGLWMVQEDGDAAEDDAAEVHPPDRIRPARRLPGPAQLKEFLRKPRIVGGDGETADERAKPVSTSPARPPRPQPSAPPATATAVDTSSDTSSSRVREKSPSRDDGEIDFAQRQRQGKFRFEFSKAEIVDIVKAISDMTRQNFIIPDKLKSQRLTILSPTKISASEAYRVFYAALAANGITLVRVGKFYKLVEAKEARKDTIPTCIGSTDGCGGTQERMVTVIQQLKHTDATQITAVIKTLLGKDGEVTLFQPTNALIISEYAPNLARIQRIVASLDVPGGDDELRIVQIQYATAAEIADKLSQVFEIQAKNTGGTRSRRSRSVRKEQDENDDEEVQISKIIADDRTNQIIIKANIRSFDAIKRLIAKLDVPISDVEQGKVHVYYLENASAEELASTLSSLAQGGKHQTPARGSSRSGNNEAESVELFEGEIKVTADKATNALIIVSSAHDFRALGTIIEKLDVRRRQVYVEVAILEVTVGDDNSFGLDWHVPGRFSATDLGNSVGGLGFLQSGYRSSGVSPTLIPLSDPSSLLGVVGGAVAGVVGDGIEIPVGDDVLNIPSFGIILKWLQTSSNANLLSTPHILTTDNEEASIEVGEKIPFRRGTSIPSLGNLSSSLTNSSTSTSNLNSLAGFGSLFSSIDRIDVSLKLKLTPQINESDKIRLEIDQQLEDVSRVDELTQQPVTSNRSAKTVVVVDDQQTIVIGGLMRDRSRESESKFPILGDIPLIGWLFKQRSSKVEKTNLLLVLTPYIVNDAGDFQRIFERKIQEYEEFAADYYGDLPSYRAHIDYSRKTGPLGHLAATVHREMGKLENGGGGDGKSVLVAPGPGKTEGAGRGDDVAPLPLPNDETITLPGSGMTSEQPAGGPPDPPDSSPDRGDEVP